MARFYQRLISNPQASLFHHGFIRTLVEYHLVSVGDNWENFLIRNNFLSLRNNPVVGIVQNDEGILPLQSPSQELQIKIQIGETLVSLSKFQDVSLPVTRATFKKKKFLPKKSLEVVVYDLKDRFVNKSQPQPVSPVREEQLNTKGKPS
jgi:hypothetical protein